MSWFTAPPVRAHLTRFDDDDVVHSSQEPRVIFGMRVHYNVCVFLKCFMCDGAPGQSAESRPSMEMMLADTGRYYSFARNAVR